MKLAIQFGHGMKALCEELLPQMRDTSIILSPRDLSDSQLVSYSNQFVALGARTFIDPQLYAPHSNHKKLTAHSYWPQNFSTGMFSNSTSIRNMLTELYGLNQRAGTAGFILPGIFCSKVENMWKHIQKQFFDIANELEGNKFATIVLSANVIQEREQINELITYIAENCDFEGIYLLPEHPNNEYLVNNPLWLTNLLDFIAQLKQLNKYVIVGYTNHQMLCLCLAMADEMASGTWMNVRSFSLSKFFESGDEIKKKNVWYYCPQALTEYTPAFLDLAFQQQILHPFKVDDKYSDVKFADILFAGALPSSTVFGENFAFRHYLSCLKIQCELVSQGKFKDRYTALSGLLNEAKHFLEFAHSHSITGQKRDFDDYIDVVTAAIDTFYRMHGALLSRIW